MFSEEEISKARGYREITKGYGTLQAATDVELEKAIADIAANLQENHHIETAGHIWAMSMVAIQNRRHIEKIQKTNDLYSKIIIALTAFSILTGVITIFK